MKDTDAWVNLQGEPPPWVAELLDAARQDTALTPERSARMERSFLMALAEQRRARARAKRNRRTMKWALAGLLSTTAAAAAVMLVLTPRSPPETRAAGATVESAATTSTAEPATRPADAGMPPRLPAKPRGR